jgi:hypothetical protein
MRAQEHSVVISQKISSCKKFGDTATPTMLARNRSSQK